MSISTAASKWPSQRICSAASPLLVPGIIVCASVPLSHPTLLAEACWVWACMDLFLCPLHRRDFCGLPSAPWVHPLCHGACVPLSWLPRPALCFVEIGCACFSSWGWPLCHRPCVDLLWLPMLALCITRFVGTCFFSLLPSDSGLMCSSHCAMRIICTVQISMPPLYQHSDPSICTVRVVCEPEVGCCVILGYLGPPSVLQGLCVLSRCLPNLGSPSPPSGWGHSSWTVKRLRRAAFSFFCPLSSCFAWFFKTLQLLLGPTCEGVSLYTGPPPVSGLPASLRAQTPAQKISIFSLFNVSILSLISRNLAWPSGSLGSSAVP